MRTMLLLMAVFVAGCGTNAPEPPESPKLMTLPVRHELELEPFQPKPAKGDKVILRKRFLGDLWDDLDAMRKSTMMKPDIPPGNSGSPEYKDVHRHKIDLIPGGSVVEVLEVGDDFVAVNVIRDKSGWFVAKHGYFTPWWKPRVY